MGIKTYRDLLTYLPRRYEDRRVLPSLSSLEDGQNATVTGRVLSRSATKSRRGLHVLRAYVQSATGQRFTAVWFNQPRSEEHTSELQSRENLVCRLLLEKKKNTTSSGIL